MINIILEKLNKSPLLIIGLLCWGSILGLNGIWWDDWSWTRQYLQTKNLDEFIYPFVSLRHVFVGYIDYYLLNLLSYFKEYAPYLWSLIKISLFIFNSYLIYYLLKLIFPRNIILASLTASLYLVSPHVNNLALVMIPYHIFICVYLLSLILTVKTFSKKNINYKIYFSSIFLFSITILGLESFIFIDILRIFIIFYILSTVGLNKNNYELFKRSLILYTPFLFCSILVLFDVIIRPQFDYYQSTYSLGIDSLSSIVQTLFQLIFKYLIAFQYIFVDIYYYVVKIYFINFNTISLLISVVATSFFYFIYFKKIIENTECRKDNEIFYKRLTLISILILICSLFPYLLTRSPATIGVGSRHALLASFSYAFFLSSLLLFLFNKKFLNKKLMATIINLIIFFSVLGCNNTINAYKNDWGQLKDFYWQFLWRVPDLKDKAYVLIDLPRHESHYFKPYFADFSGINIFYLKENGGISNHYAKAVQMSLNERSSRFFLQDINKAEVHHNSYGGLVSFKKENMIIASMSNSCLRFNDEVKNTSRCSSQRHQIINNEPRLPASCELNLGSLTKHTKKDQIIYNSNNNNNKYRWILGNEPKKIDERTLIHKVTDKILNRKNSKKEWCYYYQTANVYYHRGDYDKVNELYYEAKRFDLIYMKNYAELIPFIKSFYRTGNYDLAYQLLWQWSYSPEGDESKIEQLFSDLYNTNNLSLSEKFRADITDVFVKENF